jgi:TRAP-type mannitol/chloroaromatic compound transport system substrate-binding protein
MTPVLDQETTQAAPAGNQTLDPWLVVGQADLAAVMARVNKNAIQIMIQTRLAEAWRRTFEPAQQATSQRTAPMAVAMEGGLLAIRQQSVGEMVAPTVGAD